MQISHRPNIHAVNDKSNTLYTPRRSRAILRVHIEPMEKTHHYLREWREFRGMTQQQVSDALEAIAHAPANADNEAIQKMGRTQPTLQRIEAGKKTYSQALINCLSAVYQTTPGNLIDVNPLNPMKNATRESDPPTEQGKDSAITTSDRLKNKESVNGALQLPSISHSVPVVGYVEAGAWREMNDNDEVLEFVPFHAPEYAHLKLSGWRVSGQSVNKFYPPDSSVIGLSPHDIPLRKGSFVIVKRTRADTAEITLKQFEVTATGQWQFWPRSTDPRYQTPFSPPPRDDLAQEGWEILAIIVGESKKVAQTGDIVDFDHFSPMKDAS